ncbi:glycerate kinase [soil metagenome]
MAREERLDVLVAPDSFKGTFSSVVVAEALAEGWARARPEDRLSLMPLADCGEGTLEAVAASGGWDVLPATARDPLMRPLDGSFLRQGERALVELASASGLSRLTREERDAGAASTFGTGQILASAIGLGCRHIVVGLGGSATTDGGSGILAALGARFRDAAGADLEPDGKALHRLAEVDISGLSEVLSEVTLVVASDVTNPLLGELGAAATYGPQKGADDAEVRRLDDNLAHFADILEAAVGRSLRHEPGAGAAGGAAFGLMAIADRFADFAVRPGVEVVMELVGFGARLSECRLVLTGEGRLDAQTAFGKTAMGVARRARAAGRPVVCFGGGVTPEGAAVMRDLGAVSIPVTEAPMSLEECQAAGTDPIARAAERVASIVRLANDLWS